MSERKKLTPVARLLELKKISVAEVARRIGVSASAAYQMIHGNPTRSTLERIATALDVPVSALLDDPDAPVGWVKVPVIGRVPAGVPIEAIEEHEGDVLVPARAAKNSIALRVYGNSMIPSIRDGDVVLVKLDPDPDPGSIVVARKNLDGEVTVKRLSILGKVRFLIAENPDYDPIVFDPREDWHIIGKVTKLIRDIE